jgi:AbrB family looped-hinge helix DNA binding protein
MKPKTSTITTKGQVTLPKEFRDAFGWKPGDKVEFVKDADGIRVVRQSAQDRGRRLVEGLIAMRKYVVPSKLTVDQMMEETRGET